VFGPETEAGRWRCLKRPRSFGVNREEQGAEPQLRPCAGTSSLVKGTEVTVGVVIALLLGTTAIAGGWYLYHAWKGTPIAALPKDPRQYDGKLLSIRGKVVDRASLMVVKYFTVRDETGEIKVITDRSLPPLGEEVRVRGRIREAFEIGDSQVVVFMEAPARPR